MPPSYRGDAQVLSAPIRPQVFAPSELQVSRNCFTEFLGESNGGGDGGLCPAAAEFSVRRFLVKHFVSERCIFRILDSRLQRSEATMSTSLELCSLFERRFEGHCNESADRPGANIADRNHQGKSAEQRSHGVCTSCALCVR